MESIELVTGNSIKREICKYFTINNNLFNSILDNYLWFSDPLDFNDPYDCNLLFDTNNTEQEIREFLIREKTWRLKIGDTNVLKVSVEETVKNFLNNPTSLRNRLHEFSKNKLIKNYGICCFSENPLELLMWSHYADKHKGVCFRFDIKKDLNFFSFPLKVNYPEHYPKFNYIRNSLSKSEMTIQYSFGTKPQNYSYEKEVRILKEKTKNKNYRGQYKFNKEALIEVIFGYKTTEEQKSKIYDLLTSTGYNPTFSYTNLKDTDFGLKKIDYGR